MELILAFALSNFSDAGPRFLIVTPGAKSVSMGSAFTAICDDATACYYNPGSIAFIKNANVAAMNCNTPPGIAKFVFDRWRSIVNINIQEEPEWLPGLWPDMHYYYWSAVMPFRKQEAIGVSFDGFWAGKTTGTDEFGNPIGEWESYDYCASVTYARKIIKEKVGIGVSVKYIYSFLMPLEVIRKLYGSSIEYAGSAKTFAVDCGVLFEPVPGIRLGYSIQNLGPGLQYIEAGLIDQLPSLTRKGIAFSPVVALDNIIAKRMKWIQASNFFNYTYSCDWTTDIVGLEHQTFTSSGMDLTFFNFFSYRMGYFKDDVGHRAGNTNGYGLKIGALQLDIANDEDIYEFSTENWRVQVSLSEWTKPVIAQKNKRADDLLRLASCLALPGGGQFYNNKPIIGIPALGLGTYLGHSYLKGNNSSGWGLLLLYAVSTLEAFTSKEIK